MDIIISIEMGSTPLSFVLFVLRMTSSFTYLPPPLASLCLTDVIEPLLVIRHWDMPMNKANKEPVILGLVTSSLIRHEHKSRGKVYVMISSLWEVRRGLLGTFLGMEGDQSVGSWGGPGSEVCRQSSSNVTGRPVGLVLFQLHIQGMVCTSIALRRLR